MITLVALLALLFSLYQLFIANNALALGTGILRAFLAILGLLASRFDQEVVLNASVMMYVFASLLLLALTRSEVQIKND